ncbi:transglycosylase domain-containing protein [Bacteroides sp. ET336]|uniref:transglycosylase domain-containing protein n=1 Tax=Bacteroides sp. ET336 TaxID=2972459 RepID=UPI0021ACC82C|nr:transglycosylase domain-containing protein [Bacteroides sp. ET336]MCR8892304.1 transglycosylase domain-containing protein [Bacteroides sp. ET336]MDN0056800.1 transglycosylase domain-containing protein [Bacteroides caecigallinarum]
MRKTFIIVLWALLLIGILATYIIFSAISDGKIGYVPPIEELENPNIKFATQVISDDGKVLGTWSLSKENRLYVGYEDLSPNLVHALVATEDVRFSEHSGIDARAFMRALIKRGVFMQKNAGGGSTITQQLAKQFYSPTADNVMERLLQKPIEWVIAVKLERYYTKEEILTMYLNKFDFLNNAVGIKTAAGTYFSKEPKDLSIEEAATLIGMCKNPSLYNPRRFNERTRGRRNVVLDQMRKAGYLTEAERDSLQALPLVLRYRPVDHNDGLATYFREYLRGVLNAKKPVKKNYRGWQMQKFYEDSLAWETNPLYGWCAKNKKKDGSNYNLYTDGLKIYTTINSRMQQYAEEAVQEHVAEYLQPRFFKEKKGRKTAPYTNQLSNEEVEAILNRSIRQSERRRVMKAAGYSDDEIMKAFNTPREMTVFTYQGEKDTIMTPLDSIKYYKHFLRAGFMSMDPITGYVKAYVGGPNYDNFKYDMAMVGRRQVGSTIKPYLYSLAMENGFSPCDETRNVEGTYFDENGIAWTPRNSSKKHYGEIVTLKWGLANSNNWISAYLMSKLNPYELVRLIHSFGVLNKEIQPTISLCLGPCEISVGEMVSAYTAFVNKGIRTAPLFVTRIEDNDGNVLATFSPQVNEVISESSAYKMLVMLRAVINEGTGGRVRRLYHITADMGGKTGTTNNNSDGWFMGFTPSLVSGCWVGGEERDIHFDRMADGQGASMALPIWGIYMNKVYADKTLGYSQEEKFDIPDEFDPCKDKVSELEEENTSHLDDLFFQ